MMPSSVHILLSKGRKVRSIEYVFLALNDWWTGLQMPRRMGHTRLNCGSCGYELNLSSCKRNISTIGSKYGKSMKRGIISFLDIDESRFTQVDELQCIPIFSKKSWGIFRHRTKLLCRKCGNPIGIAYDEKTSAYPPISNGSDSPSVHGASGHRKYDVRIRALQPSSGEESGIPLFS